MRPTTPLLGAILLASALALLPAHIAHADDEAPESKVSKTQLELYVSAQEHYSEGRYDEAIALLLEANQAGRFDLFEYSLGQAYKKKGDCEAAMAYFTSSRSAPRAGPDMEARIEDAVAELEQTCPGTLTIECADNATRIFIDDGPALACPVEKLPLSPGVHDIRAELGEDRENLRMGIIPMEHHRTRVGLTPPEVTPPPANTDLQRWRPHAGHGLVGLGATSLLTALVFDVTWTRDALQDYRSSSTSDDDFEQINAAHQRLKRSQVAVIAASVGGVTALGAGAVLIVKKRRRGEDVIEEATLSLSPARDGGSAKLKLAF